MNQDRPFRSNRPGSSHRPRRGGGGGGRGGGGGGGRSGGGRRGGPQDMPMLMGEPSPSLAKINDMNTAKLQAKIEALLKEQVQLVARLKNLKALDPVPEDKVKTVEQLLVRLEALKRAAKVRLDGKLKRKAEREAQGL